METHTPGRVQVSRGLPVMLRTLIAVTQDGSTLTSGPDEHSSLGVPAVGGCSHHSSGQSARTTRHRLGIHYQVPTT